MVGHMTPWPLSALSGLSPPVLQVAQFHVPTERVLGGSQSVSCSWNSEQDGRSGTDPAVFLRRVSVSTSRPLPSVVVVLSPTSGRPPKWATHQRRISISFLACDFFRSWFLPSPSKQSLIHLPWFIPMRGSSSRRSGESMVDQGAEGISAWVPTK
jgi:hypothetical protein